MGELNIKQKKFADYYIETGNATASYLRAGYESEGKCCRSKRQPPARKC
ncbi:terminase small subunit [Bacillus sp. OV166]|nr:terminase small subunit [Bacillus sp. OV166]